MESAIPPMGFRAHRHVPEAPLHQRGNRLGDLLAEEGQGPEQGGPQCVYTPCPVCGAV